MTPTSARPKNTANINTTFPLLTPALTDFLCQKMRLHGPTENHSHSRSYPILYISLQDQKAGHNVQVVDLDHKRNNALIVCCSIFSQGGVE